MEKNHEIIGSVKLGKNVIIEKNVVIYGPTVLGDNVYIGRNSIIGYPALNNLKVMLKEEGRIVEGKSETIIGNNVMVYPNVVIYEDIKIGDNVQVFHNALIRENIEIGENCMIGTNTVLDGYSKIGNNTLIHSGAYICAKSDIGNQVFIGPNAGFVNEKTAQSRIGLVSAKNYRDIEKGPKVEDFASIGEGAILLQGTAVGKKAIIGAGAVVTKNVPQNEVWVGNPARKLKERNS